MGEDRHFPSHAAIDHRLPERVVQMVVAADDMRHLHVVVVDDDGKHVGQGAVGTEDHHVVGFSLRTVTVPWTASSIVVSPSSGIRMRTTKGVGVWYARARATDGPAGGAGVVTAFPVRHRTGSSDRPRRSRQGPSRPRRDVRRAPTGSPPVRRLQGRAMKAVMNGLDGVPGQALAVRILDAEGICRRDGARQLVEQRRARP